jgi:nucleoside-diphosphate-sugar epimerase
VTDLLPAPGLASRKRPVVAITGANGYLGSVLVAAFGSAGFSVIRMVRNPTPGSSDRKFDLNSVNVSDSLEGIDVLVHCAYDLTLTSRTEIWQTNVLGSTALFDRAISSGVARTIMLSSMSAYRGTGQLYGRAKLATELAAMNRDMCVVRPGLVYGSGPGGMAGTLRRLSSLPLLPDFGQRARQFTVHEDDLANAVVAVAKADRPPAVPMGIAHPDPVHFADLLSAFAADAGRARPHFVPTPPMLVYRALQAIELLPITLPVRADSLLGLVRPAPCVPNLDVLEDLGAMFRRFGPPAAAVP